MKGNPNDMVLMPPIKAVKTKFELKISHLNLILDGQREMMFPVSEEESRFKKNSSVHGSA